MSNLRNEFFTQLLGLDGKVAVVTGASTGIGKKIATDLAVAGAKVVVAARNQKAAAEVVAAIQKLGGTALALPVEVADEASIVRLMEAAADAFGGIDILVNNAGIFPPSRILDTSAAQWDEIQAINLRGTFLCLREAARCMKKGGKGGRIINISSNASIRSAAPDRAAYNSSKAAVNRLTVDAAIEFAKDNILVNAVLPGPVATEKLETIDNSETIKLEVIKKIPLGRFGAPGDIAAATLFFASGASSFITGQTLVVDGGTMVAG